MPSRISWQDTVHALARRLVAAGYLVAEGPVQPPTAEALVEALWHEHGLELALQDAQVALDEATHELIHDPAAGEIGTAFEAVG